MKETIKLAYELLYFMIISVPIACILYLTVNVYYEIKAYIKKI